MAPLTYTQLKVRWPLYVSMRFILLETLWVKLNATRKGQVWKTQDFQESINNQIWRKLATKNVKTILRSMCFRQAPSQSNFCIKWHKMVISWKQKVVERWEWYQIIPDTPKHGYCHQNENILFKNKKVIVKILFFTKFGQNGGF